MEPLAYLAYAALFLIVGVMIDLAITARRLRNEVSRLRATLEHGLHYFIFVHSAYPKGTLYNHEGGFSIWAFRGGKWQLEADYCREGYEPGPPPTRTDVIEGYAIRQLGVKKRPR